MGGQKKSCMSTHGNFVYKCCLIIPVPRKKKLVIDESPVFAHSWQTKITAMQTLYCAPHFFEPSMSLWSSRRTFTRVEPFGSKQHGTSSFKQYPQKNRHGAKMCKQTSANVCKRAANYQPNKPARLRTGSLSLVTTRLLH